MTKTFAATGNAQAVALTAAEVTKLGQGAVTVAATATDAAGNPATVATGGNFTLDTVAPVVVVDPQGPVGTSLFVSSMPGGNILTGMGEAGGVVSIKLGSSATVLATAPVGSDGKWSYELTPQNVSALGIGTNKLITVSQTDVAGNTASTTKTFDIDPYAVNADGVIDSTQLTKNGSISGATILPKDGSVSGPGDKLDLSGISGDVTVNNSRGDILNSVKTGNVTNQFSAKIGIANTSDVISGFDVITTGAGNDRIIGNDGLSEVMFAGAGYNQIDGGDSEGKVDYVDYRSLTATSVNKTSSSLTVAGTATAKTITINTAAIRLGDFYSVTVAGKTVGITATQEMISTPALLVSALAAQLSTFVAANQISGLNASASGNALTLNASGTNSDVVALMELSSPVSVISQVGVTVDMSTLVNT
ncbi:MAG: hypothetical protein EBQ70_00130, partial [Betaproteobacteria bacterium]|nr:hypothetical protein [Betaproteobacteria bacterium]